MPARHIISFSGPDNVGKTTHIRLLQHTLGNTCSVSQSIHEYHPGWPSGTAQEFEQWWFQDCPSEQLAAITFASCVARANAIADAPLFLVDRGVDMFEAVCIATAMLKDHIDYQTAKARVSKVRHAVCPNDTEDVKLLLRHGNTATQAVDITIHREGQVSDVYKNYQYMLNEVLEQQAVHGVYDAIIHCDGRSIIQVQNDIRKLLERFNIGRFDELEALIV